MPVTLPDITVETVTVEIRGVAVPVRGLTVAEIGQQVATKPALAALLNGNGSPAAILADPDLLDKCVLCADLDQKSRASLTEAEKVEIIKRVKDATIADSLGPFVDLAASLAGSGDKFLAVLLEAISNMKSSPQSAGSKDTDTAQPS